MGDFDLHLGGCLEVMPTLAKGSAGMCFADLPYGVSNCVWDLPIDPVQFWRLAQNTLAMDSVLLLTGTFKFASLMTAAATLPMRYDLVWHRKRVTGFYNAKKAPLRAHEHVLVFGAATYRPQKTPGKRYKKTPTDKRGTFYGEQAVRSYESDGDARYPRSVLQFDEDDIRTDTLNGRTKTRIHPTQKPLALLEWLVATYTNPGDTVLDPVFGSGTTGVACARLGRRFIGIEKDAAYFQAGKARIEAAYAEAAAGAVQRELAV